MERYPVAHHSMRRLECSDRLHFSTTGPASLPAFFCSNKPPALILPVPQEYAKGIDLSIAPQAANLQLAQLFHDHMGELNSLPSIPLWVLIQPAYECLSPSAQSPLGSPKSSPRSPSSRLARGKGRAEGEAQGGPTSTGRMPAVSFVK